MLNKSAATDARHSRSGKDAMLYNSAGKPFAQVESFTTKGSFNNYKYAPLGQNRELEVNGTVGVTVNISEIVVLDGELFNAVINAIANGESPVLMFTGVIEGRNGSQEALKMQWPHSMELPGQRNWGQMIMQVRSSMM